VISTRDVRLIVDGNEIGIGPAKCGSRLQSGLLDCVHVGISARPVAPLVSLLFNRPQ
jgi:hypothetical protein